MAWWRARRRPPSRPPSFPGWKGVSGFHCWWVVPPGRPLVEVSAELEVLQAPAVDPTWFWALQASFVDLDGRSHGAAHTGLQWYGRFADHRAVNWGGYASPPAGGVLAGTPPTLPGFADDPNTRAYPWQEGVRYRFCIRRGRQGWAATVTDVAAGAETVLRELSAGGTHLAAPVVWAEVFAPCDAPPTAARWSAFTVVGDDGVARAVDRVRVSLPDQGDCPNTDVVVDEVGVQFRTGVAVRTARHGDVLAVPGGYPRPVR